MSQLLVRFGAEHGWIYGAGGFHLETSIDEGRGNAAREDFYSQLLFVKSYDERTRMIKRLIKFDRVLHDTRVIKIG